MREDQGKPNSDEARRYLKSIGNAYVLNEASGLYEPKFQDCACKRGDYPSHGKERTPFRVHVVRDWPPIIISALTLLLLVLTVIYTRRQWLEANRNTNSSEIAANAAQSAATTAGSTLQTTVRQFQLENRAYLVPENPLDTGGFGRLDIPIRNYGHAPAYDAVLRGKFVLASLETTPTLRARIVDERNFVSKPSATVEPSEGVGKIWGIFIPRYSPEVNAKIGARQSDMTLSIRGELTYDTGFGSRGSTVICYFFQAVKGVWQNCSTNTATDLENIPNTAKKQKEKKD